MPELDDVIYLILLSLSATATSVINAPEGYEDSSGFVLV